MGKFKKGDRNVVIPSTNFIFIGTQIDRIVWFGSASLIQIIYLQPRTK